MKAKGGRRRAIRKTPAVAAPRQADPIRPWLLGAATCLIVARLFTPGVGQAQNGQGSLFVLLWLLLLAAWLLALLRFQGPPKCPRFRFAPIDVAVILFFGWLAVAGGWAAWNANTRLAINALWQEVSVLVTYLLVRQLFTTRRESRALMAVMAGLAVGMSAIGLTQVFVTFPETRLEFEEAKDDLGALYDLTGEWLPPESPARDRYQDRLYTAEPTATFALTNSLAGYLAPWFVVLCGMGWSILRGTDSRDAKQPTQRDKRPRSEPPGRWGRRRLLAGVIGSLIVVASCLFLTHSRSALVATLCGLALLWPICFASRPIPRAALLWAAAAVILLAAVAIGTGTIGTINNGGSAVTEATKSLGYRIQYWRSTWEMIADSPVVGCGPGQFQDTYTAYKLPGASEEIADPHNFLLEVWANAGTPAALALLALLVVLGRGVNRGGNRTRTEDANQLEPDGNARLSANRVFKAPTATSWPIYLGAFAGLLLGPLSALFDQLPVPLTHTTIALAVALLTIRILNGWVDRGPIPPGLLMIGVGVLLINLLAAGGIGEPAVAGTLWILIALIQVDSHPATATTVETRQPQKSGLPLRQPSGRHRRRPIVAALVVTASALLAAHVTLYSPVVHCRNHMSRALYPENRRRPTVVLRELEAATACDAWSATAARRLADARLTMWQGHPAAETLRSWVAANDRSTMLSPRAARQWQSSATSWGEVWRQTGRKEHLAEALAAWRRAIDRYPNNAHFHAEYSLLLRRADASTDARSAAQRAIQLDDQMRTAGHRDRFLPARLRRAMDEMTETAAAEPPN